MFLFNRQAEEGYYEDEEEGYSEEGDYRSSSSDSSQSIAELGPEEEEEQIELAIAASIAESQRL